MSEGPDIRLQGLRIWIEGFAHPASDHEFDRDWLLALVRMEASGAAVEVRGSFLRKSDLAFFAEELKKLDTTLDGSAELSCLEPNLHVLLRCDRLGHIEVEVDITPDQLSQVHRFKFDLDQTYLSPLVTELESVLQTY